MTILEAEYNWCKTRERELIVMSFAAETCLHALLEKMPDNALSQADKRAVRVEIAKVEAGLEAVLLSVQGTKQAKKILFELALTHKAWKPVRE